MTSHMGHELSDYERLRLANIARNEGYLSAIGLGAGDRLDMNREANATAKKRRKKTESPAKQEAVPQRRSQRIAEVPIPNYDLDIAGVVDDDEDDEGGGAGSASHKRVRTNKTAVERPPPSSDSSRALNAQLDVFLGDNVGKLLDDMSPTKAAIMALSNGGSVPKFSKYQGVVEWKNCLFLWVNIGGFGGYANKFLDDGRVITWFGGSKMHEDSDSTKRLLKTKKGGGGDRAILFVRLAANEPYCCLGDLACRKAVTDKHPISMEFELLDFDRIRTTEHFKKVLKSA